jgi:hypothetical protein
MVPVTVPTRWSIGRTALECRTVIIVIITVPGVLVALTAHIVSAIVQRRSSLGVVGEDIDAVVTVAVATQRLLVVRFRQLLTRFQRERVYSVAVCIELVLMAVLARQLGRTLPLHQLLGVRCLEREIHMTPCATHGRVRRFIQRATVDPVRDEPVTLQANKVGIRMTDHASRLTRRGQCEVQVVFLGHHDTRNEHRNDQRPDKDAYGTPEKHRPDRLPSVGLGHRLIGDIPNCVRGCLMSVIIMFVVLNRGVIGSIESRQPEEVQERREVLGKRQVHVNRGDDDE